MFDELFTRPRAVARHSAGPLLEERLRYLAHLAELGMRRIDLQIMAHLREVFLARCHAPVRPLHRCTLYLIVSRRLRVVSPSLARFGPHALRHACATHLLQEGLSLKEIGDHLGHRNPDTTRVYAKVDLAGLRQVADFEFGGLLCASAN